MDFITTHNLLGLVIAVATFLIIGLFHPIVIKAEYYFGVRCWWAFALAGLLFLAGSILTANVLVSAVLGVTGCSSFWSILEIFDQRKRVLKGWFPMNPKRKDDYKITEKS